MSETDEEKLRRHLAEFNAAVAEACDLPDDAPDHIKAMADAIRPRQETTMSEHCEHCEQDTLVQYDGWDHHCFIDGAGYVHWDDGKCPWCAAAEAERAAIVAWLRDEETCRRVARGNLADFIERGVHLRSNDE